ncbi:hypothetical protein MAR_008567 [Mya arenaria]|uniref:NADH dehydrogenase [ubiquinone] flavoprotein 3, mitochondrial n=1 Tax=Mya arenaria TaxID=6604 RepID=A0ABY7DYL9_MYAAR|nr:uncharacterized protein LOC128229990 [Mya arenaria]WAR02009.1 hypothetical protein MAR_008567 [Mya arenaria]
MSTLTRPVLSASRLVAPACRCLFATESGSSGKSGNEAPKPKPQTSKKATPDKSEPFDNSSYKCGEYYQRHEFSFFDVEGSMEAQRVGQPSSKTK